MKIKNKIRVIDTGYLSASENMCLDEAMLQAREEESIPNTIRFLSFNPHSALVGYFQVIEKELRVDYCIKNGIDLNRRITGGGALYWDNKDVGWEVFASFKDFQQKVSKLEDFYKLFCTAASSGINNFGINSKFRPRNDIEVNGKKISGSGGTSIKNAFMFQGTLLVNTNIDIMLRALRVPIEKLKYNEINSLKQRITWLSREMGYCPARNEIIKNLLNGFCNFLGMDYYFDELSKKEKEIFNKRIGYFKSKSYIYKIKDKKSLYFFKSINKTKKGIIKCSARLDIKKNILKNIVFTGDFFLYPKRAIFDLESTLKNISIKEDYISKAVQDFFKNYPQKIIGITSKDMIKAINECLVKMELKKYKIPLKYFNDIFIINGKFKANNKVEMLLMPYCAKLPSCKFRLKDDCSFCGKCSFAEAIKFSDSLGIENRTIVSYGNLKKTLLELKDKGANFFVGCCCEAFYIKHKQDFEKIGLPGILININNSTCYDLGKEEEAHEGKFEGFTNIKLPLFKKILRLNTLK
ncbi:MAG: lipoyl protein ligase domain-containing protein [Nitrososphaeraceae archaeon]